MIANRSQYLRDRYARLKAEGGERYRRMLDRASERRRNGHTQSKRIDPSEPWRPGFEEAMRREREERSGRR